MYIMGAESQNLHSLHVVTVLGELIPILLIVSVEQWHFHMHIKIKAVKVQDKI